MDDEVTTKNPFFSRTIHFNILSAAIWPFLPPHFRHHAYAQPALIAWLSIGNIILRFLTTEALRLFKASPEKQVEQTKTLDTP